MKITIRLLLFGVCISFSAIALPQTVTVNINASLTRQTIEGFGASAEPLVYGYTDNLGSNRAAALEKIYNDVKLNMGNISIGGVEFPSNLTFSTSVNDDSDSFHLKNTNTIPKTCQYGFI